MNFETQSTLYRTRFLVRARQLTEPLVFTDALGREQSGVPGDYLVESSEGIRRITAKILFEDIYVALASAELHEPVAAVQNGILRNGASRLLVPPAARAVPLVRPHASA